MNKLSAIAQRNEVDDLPIWRDQEAYGLLAEKLAQFKVNEEVFAELVSAYRGHAHKQRARGLTAEFDEIFMATGEGE